ncbi:sulfotransferase [Paraburkholderia sp. IW21]|uniref:sulfotransferase n=1 Tax=Paraburkholderia sp. IW21 TaxID=3242488 RepID=UPI0035210C8E
MPFSYDLGELGRYYRGYDALMAHWQRVLPEGVMIEVKYEDLVEDVDVNVQRLQPQRALLQPLFDGLGPELACAEGFCAHGHTLPTDHATAATATECKS